MGAQNPILYLLTGGTSSPLAQSLNSNVTAVVNPNYISAVENPITWVYQSSAITSASYASVVMRMIDVPVDGEYVIISGNSLSDFPIYQFTSESEPKVNEFYSTATTPSRTIEQVTDSLVYAMNENISFNQRFYAVCNGSGVFTIEAKNPGDRYTLNFDISNASTRFLTLLNYPGTDANRGQTLRDYSVFADLYIDSDGWFGKQTLDRTTSRKVGAGIEINYNPDNEYKFDVSNILKSYTTTSLPSINSGSIDNTSDNLINFYVVYGEKYDEFDNGFRRRWYIGESENIWGFNASLDKLQYNSLSAYTASSASTLGSVSFLTNMPDYKMTFTTEKEFLSILNYYDAPLTGYTSTWSIGGTYTNIAGTTTTFTGITPTIISSGGCLTAQVDISELGLPTSIPINTYKVALYRTVDYNSTTATTRITNYQTYRVNQECLYDYAKEIHFLNSLGGWDTFIFNGEQEIEVDVNSDIFNTPISNNPSSTDSPNVISEIEYEVEYTANSGYMSKSMFEWLIELGKSSDVRLYEDSIQKAIIITEFKPEMSTQDDLYTINIKFKYAKPENILIK